MRGGVEVDDAQGSPAHAGMAPGLCPPSGRRLRFPRPRGDGPMTPWEYGAGKSVPPPTRGWPRAGSERQRQRQRDGSPANAGMAPDQRVVYQQSGRFPRQRGDGPPTSAGRSSSTGVPPPTRGWPDVEAISLAVCTSSALEVEKHDVLKSLILGVSGSQFELGRSKLSVPSLMKS